MAVRPLISRDFASHVTGIDIPLYFTRDEASGLPSGGLKLSWASDEKDLKVILFISQPLKL
jgi:hypothetical protein